MKTTLNAAEFARSLASTGAFAFDWTWGSDHYDGDLVDYDTLSDSDRRYYDDVRKAQDVATEAMDRAREAYASVDLEAALSALQDAAAAEKEFGDCPTYRLLIDTLEAMIAVRDEAGEDE